MAVHLTATTALSCEGLANLRRELLRGLGIRRPGRLCDTPPLRGGSFCVHCNEGRFQKISASFALAVDPVAYDLNRLPTYLLGGARNSHRPGLRGGKNTQNAQRLPWFPVAAQTRRRSCRTYEHLSSFGLP